MLAAGRRGAGAPPAEARRSVEGVRAAGGRGAGAPPAEARRSIEGVRAAGRRGAGAPPAEARRSIEGVRAAGRRGAGAPPAEARRSIEDDIRLAEKLLHSLEERRRERPPFVLRGRLETRERLALPRIELL